MATITFGRQVCGSLDAAVAREWLVTDGLGGFAMGTVGGLRTRRYHGLLVVATEPPIGRRLGLAALDPVLIVGDRRTPLGTHEWVGGAVVPAGHQLLDRFDLDDGVPRWRWSVGSVVVEAELAMVHERSAVGVQWRLVSAGPHDRVGLEVEALCTWRDVHGERSRDGAPSVEATADGFVFEGAYRVRGPGFVPAGEWYRGVHHREEQARGLRADEDLWFAGRFVTSLGAGELCSVEAWSGDLAVAPPPASAIVFAARERARAVASAAGAVDHADAVLAHAADQFVVRAPGGPTIVAGYPWFGDWSRDTMTSYEGLFLDTGRADEGRCVLLAAAASISEGMLANTADVGGTEYNTVDAAVWYLHAVGRHVARTGDDELGAKVLPALCDVVGHHVAGTRFGIRVDADGLLTQGADGLALTWMDARVDGRPVTARRGKPVEVNALWIDGLTAAAAIARSTGGDPTRFERLAAEARRSFAARFTRPDGHGLFDVVDGPDGDDRSVRPNQVLAASLELGPRADPAAILAAIAPLVTSIGLRSLSTDDVAHRGRHRGDPAARDAAYHQGTVWPWLIGPYVDTLVRAGRPLAELDPLAGLEAHLAEWGVGSVSETADSDAPHDGTGCPFQAWSVAELIRARRVFRSAG
jgi:predicted glycogen debranching enzyme